MYKLTNLILTTAIWIFSTLITSDESLGNLAQYPPLGKDITVTTGVDGIPLLEPKVINLLSGKYYLNQKYPHRCNNSTDWIVYTICN